MADSKTYQPTEDETKRAQWALRTHAGSYGAHLAEQLGASAAQPAQLQADEQAQQNQEQGA